MAASATRQLLGLVPGVASALGDARMAAVDASARVGGALAAVDLQSGASLPAAGSSPHHTSASSWYHFDGFGMS